MKTLLKTVLGMQICSTVIVFIALVQHSLFYAIVITAITAIQIAPTVAIMRNMREIDELFNEVNTLRYKTRELDHSLSALSPEEDGGSKPSAPSFGAWECVKCGSVNKSGTSKCENCGAKYSFVQNPTTNDKDKPKVSRWVK
jgi:hypothetical protein